MNERIKQLLNQAGIYQPDRFDAIDGSNQMEKFAELIVKKCTKLIEQSIEDDEYWSRTTGAESIMAIEEHFGVEDV
jgi:K+/H+ antiporter YhaU regulatory subunit KhtT